MTEPHSTSVQLRGLGAVDQRDSDARRARVAHALFGGESPSQRIGRFEVRAELGKGGMGVVFAAWDAELERMVAVKVLSAAASDASRVARWQAKEARALARVTHPRVVAVHEIGVHDGCLFIVMQLVSGTNLRRWQQKDQHGFAEILSAYCQAAEGLAAVHAAGLVHRDFKPANVLIGENGEVLVADFGMASMFAATDGSTGSVPPTTESGPTEQGGTLPYMAPEQIVFGRCDARSDQFSFCVALWEAVVGVRPFERETLVALARDPDRPIVRAGEQRGPRWLMRVLARGLSPRADLRWPTMDELLVRLRETPARLQRRRRILVALPAATLAAGLVMAMVSRPACAEIDAAITSVWTSARATELRERAASGPAFATAAMDAAVVEIDAYAAASREAQAASCRATWERRQSDEQYDLVVACLERGTHALTAAVELLERGDPDTLARANELLWALPDVDDCRSTDRVRGPRQLDHEGAEDLDRAWLLLGAGRNDDAVRLALASAARFSGEGDERNAARAEVVHGAALAAIGSYADAREVLLAAMQRALASDFPDVMSDSLLSLTQLAARDTLDLEDARTWEGLLVAGAERGQLSARRMADLDDARGFVALLGERSDEAAAWHRQAIAVTERERPDDAVRIGRSRRHLAAAIAEGGDHEEALALLEAVRRDVSDSLGPEHPEVAKLEFDIGLEQLALSRPQLAASQVTRAYAVQRAAFGDHSIRLAPALIVLAQIDLALGDHRSAETHAADAWAIQREALPPDHPDRGTALALLASIHALAGDYDSAVAEHQTLLRERAATHTERERVETEYNLAWLLIQVDRNAEARPMLERILAETAMDDPIHHRADAGLAAIELAAGAPRAALARLDGIDVRMRAERIDDDELGAEMAWLRAVGLTAISAPEDERREALHRAADALNTLGMRPDLVQRIDAMLGELD